MSNDIFTEKVKSLGNVGKTKLVRMMKKFWQDQNSEYQLKDRQKTQHLNKVFQEKIQQYLPKPEIKVNPKKYGLRMFSNFIGCWYCDIVFGRDDPRKKNERGKTTFKMNKKQGYVQISDPGQSMFLVFLNANSKLVYINQIYARNATECNRAVADFRLFCNKYNFPVVKIKSDLEKGLLGIDDLEQSIAKGEHHKFGPIDGFVNASRRYSWENGDGGHLIPSKFAYFVNKVWNMDLVKGTNHTRIEMTQNPDYEEEYIAKCIYYNADQLEKRNEAIHTGINVRLKYDEMKKPFEKRPGRERAGLFELINPNIGGGRALFKSELTGEKIKAYTTSISKIQQPNNNPPNTIEITPEMLNSVEKTKTDIQVVPIKQSIPNDVEKKAIDYENEISQFKEDLIQEVVNQLKQRKDIDFKQGFMPQHTPLQMNAAVETTKHNNELLKRKPLFGNRNRSYIDRSKIKQSAQDIVDHVVEQFKLPEKLTNNQFTIKNLYKPKKNTTKNGYSPALNPLKAIE
ncbi:MAG: hypothetical protein LBR15_00685 [Methanobrevibacter sp.]|jgi:hypothetical protein|nr:hypothetical protein [Candidatus Methanovirga australis]